MESTLSRAEELERVRKLIDKIEGRLHRIGDDAYDAKLELIGLRAALTLLEDSTTKPTRPPNRDADPSISWLGWIPWVGW